MECDYAVKHNKTYDGIEIQQTKNKTEHSSWACAEVNPVQLPAEVKVE